ncbi:MAG: hypothetical protein AAGG75_22190 [Bacteroidota bacterium]
MKNINYSFLVLLVAALSFISLESNAQADYSADISCANWNQVATGCVGACGTSSTITYPVLCVSAEQRRVALCVRNEASSLCPNTGAIAKVYVNGTLRASGDITAQGSSITFFAACGDQVSVVTSTYPISNNIQCVWLGQLTVGLRRFN